MKKLSWVFHTSYWNTVVEKYLAAIFGFTRPPPTFFFFFHFNSESPFLYFPLKNLHPGNQLMFTKLNRWVDMIETTVNLQFYPSIVMIRLIIFMESSLSYLVDR